MGAHQLASKRLYYQLDPLSRRSLLVLDVSSGNQSTGCFVLSSSRSREASIRGVEMRALGGGEGGVVELSSIRSDAQEGTQVSLADVVQFVSTLMSQTTNFDLALSPWTQRSGRPFVSAPFDTLEPH